MVWEFLDIISMSFSHWIRVLNGISLNFKQKSRVVKQVYETPERSDYEGDSKRKMFVSSL